MGERSYKKGTTVSENGITVHQLLTEDEFGVPSVVLKLVSNRQTGAFVRLEVRDVDAERIGFHPDFEQDSWSIENGTLVFEIAVAPESEITTLYAVESEDTTAIEAAIDSLHIESVEGRQKPPESEVVTADPLEEQSEAATETAISEQPSDLGHDSTIEANPDDPLVDPVDTDTSTETESEPAPGTEPDAPEKTLIDLGDNADDTIAASASTSSEESTPADSKGVGHEEPGSEDVVEFEDLTESGDTDDPEPDAGNQETDDGSSGGGISTVSPSDESTVEDRSIKTELTQLSTAEIVDELVARLNEDDITERHRQRLAEAGIGEAGGHEAVREAQIAHMQSRISDVETFTDSVEQVFRERGHPADIFENIDTRFGAIESQLEELETDVSGTKESVADVTPRMEAIESTVATLEEDVSAVDEDVEKITRSQKALESDIRNLKTWRKKVTGALEAFMGK